MWLQRNNQNFPFVMELFGIWLMVSFLECGRNCEKEMYIHWIHVYYVFHCGRKHYSIALFKIPNPPLKMIHVQFWLALSSSSFKSRSHRILLFKFSFHMVSFTLLVPLLQYLIYCGRTLRPLWCHNLNLYLRANYFEHQLITTPLSSLSWIFFGNKWNVSFGSISSMRKVLLFDISRVTCGPFY